VNEVVTFKNQTTMSNNGQVTNYTWNFGDGGTSIALNPAHVYTTAGTYWVKLTTNTSFAGKTCTYKDSLKIVVTEAPDIKDIIANPDSAIAVSLQPVQFTSVYTSNLTPNTFAWTFGDNTGGSNAENPVHTYADAGLYPVQLIVTNKNGCRDTFIFQMRVIDTDSLFVPNIVTPNNDGKNDVFKVRYRQIKSYHIEIYNRWGTKVFESDDPAQVWDPIKEQDGVYYYIIVCEGRFGTNFNRKGNITIMR
jgi:gliding motility-associated-like protein